MSLTVPFYVTYCFLADFFGTERRKLFRRGWIFHVRFRGQLLSLKVSLHFISYHFSSRVKKYTMSMPRPFCESAKCLRLNSNSLQVLLLRLIHVHTNISTYLYLYLNLYLYLYIYIYLYLYVRLFFRLLNVLLGVFLRFVHSPT